jgi:Family of unknown function (DUF6931)
MATTRFVTVRDLYESFPLAPSDVGVEVNDEPALAFLRKLVKEQEWEAAVSYCAYLLPRREAVWWGCQSLRRLQRHLAPRDSSALDLAEAWVRDPEDEQRRAALDYGSQGDYRAPATWMALAAGWSGGSIVPPHLGIAPAAPDQTARAIRAGLMIAMSRVPNGEIDKLMSACLEDGVKLAERPSG